MASKDPVVQFVREALLKGHSRPEIKAALQDAGWSKWEISQGLASFAETDFSPPVPKPHPQLTARDAFVYLVLFTSLGFTAGFLISLISANLNILLPDPSDDLYRAEQSAEIIRMAISVLVIAAPVYIWMTVYTRRQIAADAGHKRSLVRKWLTYLALFVAAMFFLGDGVMVIYTFLDGEMTMRFILKALTFALISGAIFGFYLRDVEEGAKDG